MTLYERILEDEFQKLSPLIQKMHRYQGQQVCEGTVQVIRGKSLVAKLLNILMQLPKAQKNAALRLELKAEENKELWKRTFGTETFYTRQEQFGKQMMEQVGWVKMYFEVYVQNSKMHTVLKKTTVLGIPVPKRLRVNIVSLVKEEDEKVAFSVKVSSFGSKPVIHYAGLIEL
ncbi:MAG TPA: DUF4166 domain-containing protein [Campylobacterales bacterium]|nr:DUF4166 domain-containing protein [Campylobacterales bacterium]HHS92570.1 DUF4166 domain-containing protein [Campylobacterales bacterium]